MTQFFSRCPWLLPTIVFCLTLNLIGCSSGCSSSKKNAGANKGSGGSLINGNTNLPPPPDSDMSGYGGLPPIPVDAQEGVNGNLDLVEPDPYRKPAISNAELRTVYFDYDNYILSEDAKRTLDGNAQWLANNPGYQIQVEGHTDERGSTEYNMNLGDRRAKAVKAYLVSRGIDGARIHTISYGEERPVDPSSNEAAWAKNRRAQFLVY